MRRDLTKSQMRKGVLELIILGLIVKQKYYAPELALKLTEELNLEISDGTLYPLLSRLKADNYLMYKWQESPLGPPRKYYMITDRGRIFLEELTLQWNSLAYAVKESVFKKETEEE